MSCAQPARKGIPENLPAEIFSLKGSLFIPPSPYAASGTVVCSSHLFVRHAEPPLPITPQVRDLRHQLRSSLGLGIAVIPPQSLTSPGGRSSAHRLAPYFEAVRAANR
jgi:hypothetical protein